MARHVLPDGAPSRHGGPVEAAAYWDARLRSPDCTRDERAAYEEWRAADDENASAFEDLQDIIGSLRDSGSRPMMRALRDAALRKRRRRFLVAGLSAAAAIVVAVAGVAFTPMPGRPGYQIAAVGPAAASSPRVQIYETATGEQRSFTLDDGSVVTLNTRSRLEARFSAGRRDVTLVAGQGLFEVAHDSSRPFVVAVADRQVTAVGTEFDVRVDENDVRVVLVEGRVVVERRPEGRLIDPVLSDRRELAPGQSYTTREGLFQPAAVRAANVNQAMLWREGRVAFSDIPLPQAIDEMNRYSPNALIVADPSMRDLKVSGVFRTDEPQAFVNAVEEYFPVEARAQPGGDTLLVWREQTIAP